jgi:hypothetical protein
MIILNVHFSFTDAKLNFQNTNDFGTFKITIHITI